MFIYSIVKFLFAKVSLLDILALIWVGFLGACFEGEGVVKLPSPQITR